MKSGDAVYKPDLVLAKDDPAHILDIAVPWEKGTAMHEKNERETNKYTILTEDAKALFGVQNCTVGAIVIGVRSSTFRYEGPANSATSQMPRHLISAKLHLKSVHNLREFTLTSSKCSKEWTSINAVASYFAGCKGNVATAALPSTSNAPNACSSCATGTKSGLQLHCKRSHPDIFLQTCNQKTKARWSSDEQNLLAKLENIAKASIWPAQT
ncbi:hypothetical protein T07_2655 [Trichinella nelsoni]|uniref:Retrovirus-related Pol polyprotein from type-1 retrotransposable element n=1 Tax=Trichinella nelsoni TaxID=6336 RepID=A0A0V0REK3_9BILA|nr:hypothetical protein T07_2655 [Trichinella nelsoni]